MACVSLRGAWPTAQRRIPEKRNNGAYVEGRYPNGTDKPKDAKARGWARIGMWSCGPAALNRPPSVGRTQMRLP
eukprot:8579676-Pyramimonas_sp.AAC.1